MARSRSPSRTLERSTQSPSCSPCSNQGSANATSNRATVSITPREEIKAAGLAIYLDAADNDFLNAHEGAEFLRPLWEQDISRGYRLMRGADHGGLSMRPRLAAMFSWLTSVWERPAIDLAAEQNATQWLQSGMQGKPPADVITTGGLYPISAQSA